MLGNILNAGETREAEAELRELPVELGRGGWRGRGKGKSKADEEEAAAVIGSSQPWVGILRAR
jgi:hypothetical protein